MMGARSRATPQQADPSYAAPLGEDDVNSRHMETPHHSRTSLAARTPRASPSW